MIRAPASRALAENRIVSFGDQVDLVRRDGSSIGIGDSAAPIRDADGGVIGGVLSLRDVSAARGFARQQSWEAAHDLLTGLVNRREFERLAGVCVASARSAGKQHVVCYLDLDQFKVVNDNCGHAAGDELLKDMALRLQSRIRESDTLARLGGDEFGLLLEGCSLERAQLVAADLLAAIADYRFISEGRVFTIGVNIEARKATASRRRNRPTRGREVGRQHGTMRCREDERVSACRRCVQHRLLPHPQRIPA